MKLQLLAAAFAATVLFAGTAHAMDCCKNCDCCKKEQVAPKTEPETAPQQ